MKKLLMMVSAVALVLVIGPPLLYLAGGAGLAKGTMNTLMLVGTILWFVSAPFWMGRKSGGS
jgi:hypothetical protein